MGYGTSYINSGNTPQQEMDVRPLFIPLALAALGVGIYRSIQQQKQLYHSHTLTISDTSITRELSETYCYLVGEFENFRLPNFDYSVTRG